jgi:flagellar hook assembly protein FlgD
MTDTVVLVPDDVAAPMAVNLEPSQPNPTFTRTAISFDVPAHARVRLEVFNIQGQLTRVLVNTEMDLGRYRQGWDGRDEAGRAVASGVYLIRLQVGDQVRHGKLMRVR